MSELKVTGGEWAAGAREGDDWDSVVYVLNTTYEICQCFHDEKDTDRCTANTHLFAASKRLYEQLAYMAAQHKCGCKHPACKRCEDDAENEAVLAAARGEKEVEDE